MRNSLTEIHSTASRDEMIIVAKEIAVRVKELFTQDPTKTHVIELNGDPISGKSLIIDYIRAELFNEAQAPKDKDRQIAHYRGQIDGKQATVSLVNEWTDFTNLTSAFAKWGRKNEPGFVFLLNTPKFKLFPKLGFPPAKMSIDVKYPPSVNQSFALKYLHLRSHQPKTWEREIHEVARTGGALDTLKGHS